MKVDAPKAWTQFDSVTGDWFYEISWYKEDPWTQPVRVVRESDWRKIMAVVKAVDGYLANCGVSMREVINAADALRNHLEKRRDR